MSEQITVRMVDEQEHRITVYSEQPMVESLWRELRLSDFECCSRVLLGEDDLDIDIEATWEGVFSSSLCVDVLIECCTMRCPLVQTTGSMMVQGSALC
jgi:hypothetical protein